MDMLNRVTIGIRIPELNLEEVERALLQIRRKPGILDVRWSQPGEWIVPLVPVGEVGVATIAALKQKLTPFIANINHFDAVFGGFSGMPNLIQPRYVTLTFDEVYAGAMSRIATAIQEEVANIIPPKDAKSLQNYITLGRLKTESEPLRVALGRALKIPEQPSLQPLPVTSIDLLSAYATTNGMSYKVIESFPMK